VLQRTQNTHELKRPARRRQRLEQSVAEGGQRHSVLCAARRSGERRSRPTRGVAFGVPAEPVVQRIGEIDDQGQHEISLLAHVLDDRSAHPRRRVPLDPADVVARDVVAQLFERQPPTAKRTQICPGEERRYIPTCPDAQRLSIQGGLLSHGV
jgi:hypothetical protein